MNNLFFVLRAGAIAGAAIFTERYVAHFIICAGPSMLPTLNERCILFAEQISPKIGNIQRGDIVIAVSPRTCYRVCKRVTGIEGDIVYTKCGKEMTVPANHFWLEGDNIKNSQDSRAYGPVRKDYILSRCVLMVYPTLSLAAVERKLIDPQTALDYKEPTADDSIDLEGLSIFSTKDVRSSQCPMMFR